MWAGSHIRTTQNPVREWALSLLVVSLSPGILKPTPSASSGDWQKMQTLQPHPETHWTRTFGSGAQKVVFSQDPQAILKPTQVWEALLWVNHRNSIPLAGDWCRGSHVTQSWLMRCGRRSVREASGKRALALRRGAWKSGSPPPSLARKLSRLAVGRKGLLPATCGRGWADALSRAPESWEESAGLMISQGPEINHPGIILSWTRRVSGCRECTGKWIYSTIYSTGICSVHFHTCRPWVPGPCPLQLCLGHVLKLMSLLPVFIPQYNSTQWLASRDSRKAVVLILLHLPFFLVPLILSCRCDLGRAEKRICIICQLESEGPSFVCLLLLRFGTHFKRRKDEVYKEKSCSVKSLLEHPCNPCGTHTDAMEIILNS